MDHTALISSLSSERKTALTTRSDAAGLRHLALYVGAISLCSTAIIVQIPAWPLFLLPQGILLAFLFTLSHECTHQTPFKSRALNEIVGHCIAVLMVLPFIWFRYFHLAHHKYTNDPDRDPELAGGGRPSTWRAYLIYLSGWGYWSGMLGALWTNAFGTPQGSYLPKRQFPAMRAEARIILSLYVLAALSLFASPLVLWVWLFPLLLGQPILRLYLLAEHGHCPPVANMLENTRTTFTNRLVRFLAWNMPYHAEHHSYPNVPFHQLPALHEDMAAYLKSTSDGYVAFTQDYARGLDG
jgi:fatty acid desaturase